MKAFLRLTHATCAGDESVFYHNDRVIPTLKTKDVMRILVYTPPPPCMLLGLLGCKLLVTGH